jgi:hypothetical protein
MYMEFFPFFGGFITCILCSYTLLPAVDSDSEPEDRCSPNHPGLIKILCIDIRLNSLLELETSAGQA